MKTPSQLLTERIIAIHSKFNVENRMNLAISGGSSPDTLFNLWSGEYSQLIDWRVINIYWVDERCVPPDHPESNYGRAFSKFLSKLSIPENNIFRIKGEISNLDAAKEYNEIIRTKLGDKGFDIVILGVGEDGHTSSVFPGQTQLYYSDYFYMPSFNPKTGQKRISLTLSGILKSEEIVFYLEGPSKLGIIKEISMNRSSDSFLPAEFIIKKAAKTWIYWDNSPSLANININSIFVI